MLVADLRALNAKLHAFLRAAEGGHTRKGHGHHDNSRETEVNYTIRTDNTYSHTTYEDEFHTTPMTCISPPDTVKAFFQATPTDGTPINANVMERPKFEGNRQVGAIREVLYRPCPLEFEIIYKY
jgi:hypothetical protein